MKIFITGGTGFVGMHLSERLLREGHEVTVLTRGAGRRVALSGLSYIEGDPTVRGKWQQAVAGHEAVVNLAGTSIFGRWTPDYKEEIRLSRILTTSHIVESIPEGSKTVLLSTSAVGYYGFHGDEELDESAPPGDDFLARVAVDWEREALKAEEKGTRVVLMRFGIVLGRSGGALQQIMRPFRWFLGGPIGSGKQWFSWIHVDDLVSAICFLMGRGDATGPYNLTSPNPVRNKDFACALGKAMGRPSILPAPGFMIRLILGEFGSIILQGQRVLPKRLSEAGFQFKYPDVENALKNLLTL